MLSLKFWAKCLLIGFMGLSLFACGGGSGGSGGSESDGTGHLDIQISPEVVQPGLSDSGSVQAYAQVDGGQQQHMSLSGSSTELAMELTQGDHEVTITLEFIQTSDPDNPLTLAQATKVISVNPSTNNAVEFTLTDFDFSAFDDDNDGFSNLSEMQSGSSAPVIETVSPASNSVESPTSTLIQISFDDPIDPATLTDNVSVIENDAGAVEGTVTYSESTHTVTFTPSQNLNEGQTYTVTVSSGILNSAGIPLATTVSWSFTTQHAPPEIKQVTPANNSVDINLNTGISVTFDTAIDETSLTGNFTLVDSSSNNVEGTVSYDSASHVATFSPTLLLTPSETYTATINTNVRSTAGLSLTSNATIGFTTVAPSETISPSGNILFPPKRSLTDQASIVVRGTSSDASGISYVLVNGVLATSEDGFSNWVATVALNSGDNRIQAIVTDTQGNQTSIEADIRYAPLGTGLSRLVIDKVNNQYLAFKDQTLISIDRSSGLTEVVSEPGSSESIKDLEINSTSTRAMILDEANGLDALNSINLSDGTRTTISQDTVDEPAGTYHQIQDIAFASLSGEDFLFIADAQQLIKLDLSTKSRSVLYRGDSLRAVVWDNKNQRLLLFANRQEILSIDPTDGTATTLSSNSTANSTSNATFRDVYGITYDEANDVVYTVGYTGTDTIVRVDLSDGSRTLISDNSIATDTSEVDFSIARKITLDAENKRLLVTAQSGVIAVDIDSGTRTWVMQNLGRTAGIHFNPDTGTITVLGWQNKTLYSFEQGNAEPRITSDNTTALASSNTSFGNAWALAVDETNSTGYVSDFDTEQVFSVDLSTGIRRIVSDNSEADSENTLISPRAIVWKEDQELAYILDNGRRSVISINTSTGARSVISSTFIPNDTNTLRDPVDMVAQPGTGELLILDKGIPAVVSVNPSTGERSIYGSIPDDPWASRLADLTYIPDNQSILIDDYHNSVTRINRDLSYESVLSAYIESIAYDGSANQVIALESENTPIAPREISRINLDTGEITALPVAPTPNSNIIIDEPVDIALDEDAGFAYIVDKDHNAILKVNIQTGFKEYFASNSIATADSNYDFRIISGIGLDKANNRLLVGDRIQNALIAIDLSNGARTLVTDDTVAISNSDVSIRPKHIEIDAAGEFAYLTSSSFRGVAKVNLTNGERLLVSDNTIATASSTIDFSYSPTDIALDEANNRALVIDQGGSTVISVDLSTGARTIFNDTGQPYYIAIGKKSGRAMIVDGFSRRIYAADLSDGVANRVRIRSNLLFPTFGLRAAEYNENTDTLLLLDGYNDMLISVDLITGDRVILSK